MLDDRADLLNQFNSGRLSPGRIATLACLLEVTAPKPGNVHRAADFEDVTFQDFIVSGVVLGNVIDGGSGGIGQMIFEAVSQTKSAVGTNTNLGMILLLCPLAKAFAGQTTLTIDQLKATLAELDADDCRATYEAIRLASPGGLGRSEQYDVHDEAPTDLVSAMKASAEHDMIACQYGNGFEQVFGDCLSYLLRGQELFADLSHAIVFAHVHLLADYPDSLIQRKNDLAVAQHAQFLAGRAVEIFETDRDAFWAAVGDLDLWLRSDGHRRNPGTTADLIAAGLFVGLCNGVLKISSR